MKCRFHIREWFCRVPTGVWVFLALTQFGSFVNCLFAVPRLQRLVSEASDVPALQQKFIDQLAAKETALIASLFLFPLFLALAKIRMGRCKQREDEKA